jgi:hypothetical protein
MTIAEGEGGADFKTPLGCKPNGMSAKGAAE